MNNGRNNRNNQANAYVGRDDMRGQPRRGSADNNVNSQNGRRNQTGNAYAAPNRPAGQPNPGAPRRGRYNQPIYDYGYNDRYNQNGSYGNVPYQNYHSGTGYNANPNGNPYHPSDRRYYAYEQELEARRAAARYEAMRRRAEAQRRRKLEEEKLRRLRERIKAENRRRRRRAARNFLGRSAVAMVIALMLAAVVSVGVLIHFNSAPDGHPSSIVYTCGGKKVRTAAETEAYRNGKMYVCFNDLMDYLGLHVIGNADSYKYIFPAEKGEDDSAVTEDSVVFMDDSRTVYINSRKVTLPAESFIYGEEVWVSADFISEYMNGITLQADRGTIDIARIVDESLSTETESVYLDVSLTLKAEDPIVSPGGSNDSYGEGTMPEIKFSTDLAAYEEYMNPENYSEYLTLASVANPLSQDYAPTDLTDIINTRADGRAVQQMRLCAAKALEALYIELYAAGYTDVSVMSGYRDYWTQYYLHNMYITDEQTKNPALSYDEAKAIVLAYSAEPGTSEHQTGLCVDMHNLDSAVTDFANEDAYQWLYENAWKFGFILRYPADKTEITGISFEPWHWRFVGRTAAYEIHSEKLCFEEYLLKK